MGDGLGNQSFQMLDLKGLELEEAEFVLRGYGLKLGEVFYKEKGAYSLEEKDSDGAMVFAEKGVNPGKIFKQVPRAKNKTKIGQSIDLWIVQIDSTEQNIEIPTLGVVNED